MTLPVSVCSYCLRADLGSPSPYYLQAILSIVGHTFANILMAGMRSAGAVWEILLIAYGTHLCCDRTPTATHHLHTALWIYPRCLFTSGDSYFLPVILT